MKASGPSSLRGIELSCLRLQIPADIGRMTGRGLVDAAPPGAACDPQETFSFLNYGHPRKTPVATTCFAMEKQRQALP